VGTRDEVGEGTFFVDHEQDELVLGSSPDGRTVTASALTRALRIRSEGMVVRGIGIRKYAPSVPHMGAVTVEAPRVVLDGVAVTDSATRCIGRAHVCTLTSLMTCSAACACKTTTSHYILVL